MKNFPEPPVFEGLWGTYSSRMWYNHDMHIQGETLVLKEGWPDSTQANIPAKRSDAASLNFLVAIGGTAQLALLNFAAMM